MTRFHLPSLHLSFPASLLLCVSAPLWLIPLDVEDLDNAGAIRPPACGECRRARVDEDRQRGNAERRGDVLARRIVADVPVAGGDQSGEGAETSVPGDGVGFDLVA